MSIKILLRVLIGLVLLLSAVLKLISIDTFELYIFSHKIFSLNFSYVFARLIISFEFVLGVLLITNMYFRYVWYIVVLTFSGFTIFLIFFTTRQENCHCFGDLLKITPMESIIKNIIILFLMIPLKTCKEFQLKNKGIWLSIICLAGISIPAIISPPDFINKKSYAAYATINYNKLDTDLLQNKSIPFDLSKGKKVLCFYSTKCRFCKLAQSKISSIVHKNNLDSAYFINVFWGKEKELDKFFENSPPLFPHIFIPVKNFLEITDGNMPVIILLENGKITNKYSYRNIEEKGILNFLEN